MTDHDPPARDDDPPARDDVHHGGHDRVTHHHGTRGDGQHGAHDHGDGQRGAHDHGQRAAHSHGDGPVDEAAYFDASADDWDDEGKVIRSRVIATALRDRLAIDQSTTVFEYGAGTGLATQLLAATGPLGPVTLAEPSDGMRRVATAKVERGDLPTDARVLDLDLATAPAPDDVFDLVLVVMTLHHIPEVEQVVAALADLVAPGGHLAVVELEADDGSFHAHLDQFHGHDGFTSDRMRTLLTGVGLTVTSVEHVHDLAKDGRTYPIMLALGSRS